MNAKKFSFMTVTVVIVTTLLALSSLAQDSTETEDLNPGPLALSEAAVLESTFEPPPQPGRILLLKGSAYSGNGSQVLDYLGYEYTSVPPGELATTNLNKFDIILVAWAPYQATIDALNARKDDLESWISDGGGIVVNAEWSPQVTNPYSFLPATFGATECPGDNVHIEDTTHPLVNGLTDELLSGWGASTHGQITEWPLEATVVSRAADVTNSPHIIGMNYGGGKIVVTASDPEWHAVTKYYPKIGAAMLVSNELHWVARVSDAEGPITSDMVALTNPVAVNTDGVVLMANVDDTTTGGSNIESAEYTLDGTNWCPMAAQDGAFDSVSETVTATFTAPAIAGIYGIAVFGTDVVLNVGDPELIMLVVYDPDGGFVTGGGWIDSPLGAYTPSDPDDDDLTGKANFGFVSKYKKGAEVPTGQTEFVFQAGDLNFHSSSYDWLVVTGSDYAMFKGIGTINGSGEYKFMLWAGDRDPDTFRIKIWTEVDDVETIVYDNGMDQEIGGGSIVVHTK